MKSTFVPPGFKIVLAALFFLTLSPSIEAQFIQQGSKLIGTGAVSGALLGGSVSLSSDGNTAIEGENGGGAFVWVRSSGVWTQQGSVLAGSGSVGGANQGQSVSISSDGNTAIVSGPNDNGGIGAVWIWTRLGSVWTQQGGKLVGTGFVGSAEEGQSVYISGDGNTVIVGGILDNGLQGAAWVWTRSGSVWTQQGGKLVGTGAASIGEQGASVSLSYDGNTAIVGGNGGGALVWIRSGGAWTLQGSKLVGTGAVGSTHLGWSVSLSSDGNTAIVGGYQDDTGSGAAWVWSRSGGKWTQQGNKLVGTGAIGGAGQGSSVSLDSDGNIAIIGGINDNSGAGAAWVWTRSGGKWTQQGNKLVGTGAVGLANQGQSVFISADGNTAIVGGFYDNGNTGAAWVFTQSAVPVLPRMSVIQRVSLEDGKSMKFDLTQKSHITIKLFNTKGQLISNLLDETRAAGDYSISLPAEFQRPGYFLDYRAGDYHKTFKINP